MTRVRKYPPIITDLEWNDLIDDYARRLQAPATYVVFKQDNMVYADHCLGTGTDYSNSDAYTLIQDLFTNLPDDSKVLFKGGSFDLVTHNPLLLDNKKRIVISGIGEGTYFYNGEDPPNNIFKVNNCEDIVFENFKCNNPIDTGEVYTDVGIYALNSKRVLIDRVNFFWGNRGVLAETSEDVVIKNSFFYHILTRAIEGKETAPLIIRNNLLRDTNSCCEPFYITYTSNWTTSIPIIIIDHNRNLDDHNSSLRIFYVIAPYLQFTSNQIKEWDTSLTPNEMLRAWTRHAVISDNIFYTSVNKDYDALTIYGSVTRPLVDVKVERNKFIGGFPYGVDFQANAYVEDVVLEGNTFQGQQTGAINPSINNIKLYIRNNKGYNPVGTLSTPFETTTTKVGLCGDESAPTADTLYEVFGVDIWIKATSQTGGTVKVYASDGTTELMDLGASGFDAVFLPIGYKINFGAFTSAPTVTVVGN